MSTVVQDKMKCTCCGKKFGIGVIGSTSRLGYMDLDTRPPQMLRSTMMYWIHTCPKCGFVNDTEKEDNSGLKDYIKTEEYTTCEGYEFDNELAAGFYRLGLINIAKGEYHDAFMAFLKAAWCFDDKNDEIKAAICRERAISVIDSIKNDREDSIALYADVYRRVGRFSEFLNKYPNVQFDKDILNTVMKAEKMLAAKGDTKCHNLGEFLEEKK